jgi:hypothetical protein
VKRKQIIDEQIARPEGNLKKIKNLKQTDDNREMLEASTALYECVLPVYRNEYQQIARLYDKGANREQIDSLASSIETKYGPGFETRFDQLIALAKPYATRHDIKVKWDVRTEPGL